MWGKAIVPAIRFTGFTDAWEQRKISDTAPLQRGFDLPSADMKPGDYPVVMSNGIGGYHSECKAKGPGVVTGRSGTIGKLHYIEGNYWPHNTSLWVTSFKGNSPKFIYYLYQKLNLGRFGSGSGVPTLNRNDVHDAVVMIPSFKEQERLAEYLTHLDHLITLHQRKYSRLCNIKKSMLERMFPKEGASVPEIRFAGFTDAWEQHEFGEIVVRSSEMSSDCLLPRVEYEDIISGIGLLNKDITKKPSSKTGLIFHEGDVLYGKLRPYLKNWLIPSFQGIAVGDFWVLRPQNTDSSFVYRLIQTQQFDEVANQSVGTKMPRADWKLVSKVCFYVPTTIHEQEQLGAFFRHLDHLITLHQHELEQLQNIKKSCLEKMFV